MPSFDGDNDDVVYNAHFAYWVKLMDVVMGVWDCNDAVDNACCHGDVLNENRARRNVEVQMAV